MAFTHRLTTTIRRVTAHSRSIIAGVVVIAGIGTIFLVNSHAATPAANAEAESGVSSGKVATVSDSSASGGQAVKFGGNSSVNPLASLPLIPWDGGPAYYNQFPAAVASGWTDPSFFPIEIWFNGAGSNDTYAKFDKSYGINTYAGQQPGDYTTLKNNHMYWLGADPDPSFPSSVVSDPTQDTVWPGEFLQDEIDGTASSREEAYNEASAAVNARAGDGRFKEYNYTQIVVGNYPDPNNYWSTKLINFFPGPVSVDTYWYSWTNDECVQSNTFNYLIIPMDAAHCATASSYGKLVKALQTRDATDGELKPVFSYVEEYNVDGLGPANPTGGQLEGAVMDSIINGANGIDYFNTVLDGPCGAGSLLRAYEASGASPSFCAASQLEAMKKVNAVIKNLAPVINTQSYQYSFGSNMDTMLKWYNGSAYIFAMVSGDASSEPGNRTFTLPAGLANVSSVQVLNENRSINVSGGKFTDNFPYEYTYHIYKVTP